MNDYTPTKLSTATKVAAQFIQRTRWVMNLQTERTEHEHTLEMLEKQEKQAEKRLAIRVFKHEQAVKNEDPRVEEFAKSLETEEKYAKTNLKDIEKDRKTCTDAIEKLDKTMEEIESGKKEVRADKTVTIAKELVQTRVTQGLNEGEFNN